MIRRCRTDTSICPCILNYIGDFLTVCCRPVKKKHNVSCAYGDFPFWRPIGQRFVAFFPAFIHMHSVSVVYKIWLMCNLCSWESVSKSTHKLCQSSFSLKNQTSWPNFSHKKVHAVGMLILMRKTASVYGVRRPMDFINQFICANLFGRWGHTVQSWILQCPCGKTENEEFM
jgi:hypothetical protein